jgi:hypothetical protein
VSGAGWKPKRLGAFRKVDLALAPSTSITIRACSRRSMWQAAGGVSQAANTA